MNIQNNKAKAFLFFVFTSLFASFFPSCKNNVEGGNEFSNSFVPNHSTVFNTNDLSSNVESLSSYESLNSFGTSQPESLSSFENSQQELRNRFDTIVEHYYYDNGSLTQWNQSMAIYNNRVFLFLDTNAETATNAGYSFVVMDLMSKSIIYKGITPTRNCHNNNAQFLNTFYDSKDKYPLLLLSRGDYPWSNESGNCYVIRITELNDEFNLEIVKTIACSIPQSKYNGSWVVDRCGNMFLYTMTEGDWQTPESDGNRAVIYQFEMFDPMDSSELVLCESDVIAVHLLDYCVLQGADSINGKLYLPIGHYTKINGILSSSFENIVAVFNPASGLIEETIPSDTMENEGISFYNNKMYISSVNSGGNFETTTPTFKIQSLVL